MTSAMDALRLRDGRTLEYMVTGPPDGIPLIVHHGTPMSGLQMRGPQRAAQARGMRLVTYSRPGYGGSTRMPGRDVAAAVADSEALLEHLDAERCVVLGFSGGGPHALAMAAWLPEHVAAVATIASIAPYTDEDLDHSSEGEDALRRRLEDRAVLERRGTAAALCEVWSELLSEVDQATMAQEFGDDLAACVAHAVRTSIDGYVDDNLAHRRPWGFALEDITVPSFLWHGDEDMMVPIKHGHWLARRIPGVTAHWEKGEGHMSLCANAFDRALAELSEYC